MKAIFETADGLSCEHEIRDTPEFIHIPFRWTYEFSVMDLRKMPKSATHRTYVFSAYMNPQDLPPSSRVPRYKEYLDPNL